jgi:tRNA threonylcarbamoyladenosine biosynthesis protein TsaB
LLPTILAIDTAADVCSVALAFAGNLIETRETVGHRHSERLLPIVEELLVRAGIELAACDAIAFGAGPGSFTGLRIACGVAQGLAYGAGKPVIAVGNLEALAFAALREHADAMRVACANDARMQAAYCAVYERDGDAVRERAPPVLVAAGDLATFIARWSPQIVAGDATHVFAGELESLTPSVRRTGLRASASAIASCALQHWRTDGGVDPALAAPLYVRDHVALTIEERRARAARIA